MRRCVYCLCCFICGSHVTVSMMHLLEVELNRNWVIMNNFVVLKCHFLGSESEKKYKETWFTAREGFFCLELRILSCVWSSYDVPFTSILCKHLLFPWTKFAQLWGSPPSLLEISGDLY